MIRQKYLYLQKSKMFEIFKLAYIYQNTKKQWQQMMRKNSNPTTLNTITLQTRNFTSPNTEVFSILKVQNKV